MTYFIDKSISSRLGIRLDRNRVKAARRLWRLLGDLVISIPSSQSNRRSDIPLLFTLFTLLHNNDLSNPHFWQKEELFLFHNLHVFLI